MDQHSKIILFKDQTIRSHWDADQEEWFFLLLMWLTRSQTVRTPQII